MRILAVAAFLLLVAAEAVAQSVIVPRPIPDFQQRMDSCTASWNATAQGERGTMSYRQFTTKCVGGQVAKPINTVALCRNGSTAPATAPQGACAYDGGVDRWLD